MSICGTNSRDDFHGIGSPDTARKTEYVVIDAATPKPIVSTIKSANGTLAYQLGTRNAATVLRLKDGETQVLAGLIQDSDRRNSSHVPGLGDLPLIGRLFGSNGSTIEKNEIVLSITPRIIRAQTRPSSETTEFWYGTETQTRSAQLCGRRYRAATPSCAWIAWMKSPPPCQLTDLEISCLNQAM